MPSQTRAQPHRVNRGDKSQSTEEIVIIRHQLTGSITNTGEKETPDEGFTYFSYQENFRRYDTGYFLIVKYRWNQEVLDCVENGILTRQTCLDAETLAHEVLPKVHNLLPVTTLELRTVGGSGSLEVSELPRTIPAWTAYPHVPDTLARIPRLPISALQIRRVMIISDVLDFVTIDGDSNEEWYAFKRYAIPLENQGSSTEGLLSEVKILYRSDSPYIIKPSFLITEKENNSIFRGFLTPFMPAGTLEDVFLSMRTKQGPPSHEQILSAAKLLELLACNPAAVSITSAIPRLGWNVKYTWAIEAASAVVTLHDGGTYCGDIKIANILLDRNGHLQLIDVAPTLGWTDDYIGPEFDLEDWDSVVLTEARDIYAFGLVLWQIAEEAGKIHFPDRSKPLDLAWRSESVPESTPQWFRNLVARCVNRDPSMRPSAKDILQDLLDAKR